MPLDESILAAVANANFKSMAELAVQNVLSHQQRLQILAEKSLAKSLESMDTIQATEQDASATAAIDQILSKLAQTTRPETGAG
jgi:ribosome-associated translation inhibitor RaiA